MPPKPKVSKEQVVDAAAQIVKESGMAGLTAKSLAAALHCSTQPIFWHFEGMDAVRDAVAQRALERFDEYLRAKAENVSAYKAIGINYIRFAAEEREFFRLLFMSEHTEKDIFKTHTEMPYVLKVLEEEENITGALAQDIYEEMWLFSHGVATMIATGTAKFTQERIEEMLTAVYRGLINKQTQKKERRQE